jgi:6-phosphogluconate dehydrogenase
MCVYICICVYIAYVCVHAHMNLFVRNVLKLDNDEIANVFSDWNDGDLNRYACMHIYVCVYMHRDERI